MDPKQGPHFSLLSSWAEDWEKAFADIPNRSKRKERAHGPLFPFRLIRVDQKAMFRPSEKVEVVRPMA